MSEKRPLILGATSLIGRSFLPMMSGEEPKAWALSRRPPHQAVEVDWLAGDLEAPGWSQPVAAVSTVFSLSPIWLLPGALPVLIEKGAERVVAFSSTSLFTKDRSPLAAERAQAELLAGSEKAVRDLCQAAGVNWTILRPTLVYAEGRDANVSRLASLIRRFGFLPLAGEGQGLRQPVHAEDLAQAAKAAAASPAAANHAYDLPGGETLTYRQMAERVFQALGRRPRIIATPKVIWSLAFALARPWLPGATAAMGVRMSQDLVFDGSAAARDLDWRPRAFHPDFQS